MKIRIYSMVALLGVVCSVPTWAICPITGDSNVQLQILGSGGPNDSGGRASSSYVLWVDGVGRILVDAGSGTKVPFHTSGANFNDIDLVALSHFHPDHSAELPALLWTSGGDFRISGPSASEQFPSLDSFLESLFGEGGAFNIVSGRLNLDPITVDVSSNATTEIWRDGDILVQGRSVPHGTVPAVGYRVDVGDYSIAFTSDQNGSDPSFSEFAKDVNVMVIHMTASEDSTGGTALLHAKPSVWGQMAAAANAGHVVVSHISTGSPQVLNANLAVLRDNYSGSVTVAEDLTCVEVI
jgi:ribonuclease BN (tRNA processing enzyme)